MKWRWGALFLLIAFSSLAEDKINYQDHILPLVEANCSKCHNPDKRKADLDLTSYQGALKGSGSGVVVVSGNPDSSKLWKALTHSEEPYMPPNRGKLSDKELDTFRKWITGGLLETANGKAIAAAPVNDLTLKADAIGKPEGPPPMPAELPIDPVVHTSHLGPILGLACSPWAPLIAVAGQRQILLYNTDSHALVGILPFSEGQPADVKFSSNGKLLLASGGRGAKSGRVVVWNILNGERLMTVGGEYDTILTCDIRADQSQIAYGGPTRLVKIYSSKTGEIQFKLKKHTDWVTAVAFSPNGKLLASADRNGGISIWDPDNGQELFTLAGHKSGVTALSWRGDSKLLASSSEDGAIKVWEMQEGKQVKNWTAHGPGALWVDYSHDGRLVSCGRDNTVTIWDSNGGKVRSLPATGDIPMRVAFTHDGKSVFAANFEGHVAFWSDPDWKQAGELEINPVPLAEQLEAAKKRVANLQAEAAKSKEPSEKSSKSLADARRTVTRIEAALLLSSVYHVRENLAAKKNAVKAHSNPPGYSTVQANASTSDKAANRKAASEKSPAQQDLAKAKPESPPADPRQLAAEIKAQETELDRLLAQYHNLMSSAEEPAQGAIHPSSAGHENQ
jgi:WD40 repeat protein